MEKEFKRRLWIGVSIIAVSVILAAVGFYILYQDIDRTASNVVAAKTTIQDQALAAASFAQLETDAPKAAKYQTAIEELIPTQAELITFNSWIGAISKRYQVNASAAFQGEPVAAGAGTPGTASFTLDAQGPSGSILPFVSYISSRATGFFVSFTSFDFTTGQGGDNLVAGGTLYFR